MHQGGKWQAIFYGASESKAWILLYSGKKYKGFMEFPRMQQKPMKTDQEYCCRMMKRTPPAGKKNCKGGTVREDICRPHRDRAINLCANF